MEDSLKRAKELLENEKLDEAEQIYNELLPEADEKQTPEIRMMLGLIYSARGKPDEALDHYNISLELFRKIGNKAGEGNTLGNMICAYRQKKNDEKALECIEESKKIHKELGNERALAQDYFLKGLILEGQSEYLKAIGYMEESKNIVTKIKDKSGEANIDFALGNIYRQIGEREKAIGDYKEALEIAKKLEFSGKDQFIGNIEKSLKELGG